RTYLGRKPERLVPGQDMEPQLQLQVPVMFAAMSYGAVSLNVHRALAMAAREMGTFMNAGEGGLHRDLWPYGEHIIVQCASGRFGVDPDYLRAAAAVEIKIGQGAKPGIGGHLPGEKVTPEIAATRTIPVGTDAISPAGRGQSATPVPGRTGVRPRRLRLGPVAERYLVILPLVRRRSGRIPGLVLRQTGPKAPAPLRRPVHPLSASRPLGRVRIPVRTSVYDDLKSRDAR
ncbi:MAG: hypothetical protein H5U04_13455, partial [Firmicutes bacterium]|nr:hypothetical protein [Bacillota bacterium]